MDFGSWRLANDENAGGGGGPEYRAGFMREGRAFWMIAAEATGADFGEEAVQRGGIAWGR
jgi:hypothetical protein